MALKMTDPPKSPSKPVPTPREQRRAEALKANLKRRKQAPPPMSTAEKPKKPG